MLSNTEVGRRQVDAAAVVAVAAQQRLLVPLARALEGAAAGGAGDDAATATDVVLGVVAPALADVVVSWTGEPWRPEVEVAVDLCLAGLADDVADLVGHPEVLRTLATASTGQVLDLVARLTQAAVSVQSVWMV